MKMNIRTNHKVRLDTFDQLNKLKKKKVPRKQIIGTLHAKSGVPIGTLYSWYAEKSPPYGRKGEIEYTPELFYVLGALLGDGCSYRWKITHNHNILVGDKEFTTKYATMLNKCIDRQIKPYIDRSKNIWFVKSNNFQLYKLFEKVRKDLFILENMLTKRERKSSILFLEGFFDVEGCVKIIKEKVRKTPKICLDITNTDFNVLEICRRLFKKHLDIETRYSVQRPKKDNRKVVYHLRIYKKEYIRKFFENISTTKLKPNKVAYLEKWLNNKK